MGNKNIDEVYWMKIVDQIAEASTCRVKIGCVLVHKRHIVGIGYVGSISGDVHCDEVGCLLVDNHGERGSSETGKSCCRTVHAEANSVLKCATRGSAEIGWLEAYLTYSPCLDCLKLLLQIGVRKFIFKKNYKDVNRDLFLANLWSTVRNEIEFRQCKETM